MPHRDLSYDGQLIPAYLGCLRCRDIRVIRDRDPCNPCNPWLVKTVAQALTASPESRIDDVVEYRTERVAEAEIEEVLITREQLPLA